MDSPGKWQFIITLVLGLVPWLFPDLTTNRKLICLAPILAASVLIYLLRLNARLKLALKNEKDLSQRHNALAEQFDNKRELETKYRKAFSEIGILLRIANLDSERAKIDDIYRMYIHNQHEIDDGGN